MTRILGWLVLAAMLSASSVAEVAPGSISGSVTNSAGIAQMGAMVEMLAVGTGQRMLAYTDTEGHFTIAGLTAGSYDIHVSAPSFLPSVREDVTVAAGAVKVVNFTLNTLFEAARMMPQRLQIACSG